MRVLARHPLAVAPGVALASAAVAFVFQGHDRLATLAIAALIVGGASLLEVDLPWGGRVPLGYAALIAVAVLLAPIDSVTVAVAAILVVFPFRPRWRDLLPMIGGSGAAAVAAVGAEAALGAGSADVVVLLEVVVVGVAFLGVDLAVGRRRLDQVAPLYVTLLCAAALLAVAYEQRAELAIVAAVPLLVTRYSFGRFAQARRTYAQTTQALSLLPEVAGLTPLGHGERTAVYAGALADALGFDPPAADRITTAARLHHIGYISLHEPEERDGPIDSSELGRVSAELLRETGFLSDVAELVEQVQLEDGPAATLDAAVIRVASTLDDVTAGGAGGSDAAEALLRRHPVGLDRTAAIALLRLHDLRPEIVSEASDASRLLAMVAGAGATRSDVHHHAEDPGHDCR